MFLYIYMYILAILKNRTNRTNAGGARLCACTVFVMVYGLDDFQFFDKSVLEKATEIDIGIQSALI